MTQLKKIPAAHNIAPNATRGIQRVQTVFVNLFLVDSAPGEWVLVDAGLPGFTQTIRDAVAQRYETMTPPSAIILTHGHFDHVGCLHELLQEWEDVTVYCHPLELPYLTGKSDFPPQDPTVGGAGAFMSRAFPKHAYDFSGRIAPLPEDGTVPGLPDWSWVPTPGHTPGHVALWRDNDRTLISGDAVISMDMDSWLSHLTHRVEISRPPTYFTADWEASARSVRTLANLRPEAIFTGHGATIEGENVPLLLERFARRFPFPEKGRYVNAPAVTDERGVVALPPKRPDHLPIQLLGAALLGYGLYRLVSDQRSQNEWHEEEHSHHSHRDDQLALERRSRYTS